MHGLEYKNHSPPYEYNWALNDIFLEIEDPIIHPNNCLNWIWCDFNDLVLIMTLVKVVVLGG